MYVLTIDHTEFAGRTEGELTVTTTFNKNKLKINKEKDFIYDLKQGVRFI